MKQEYRHMMEQIRLTDEEKERIMENIENKRASRSHGPGRRLVVLAVAAALMVAAMGAGLAVVQGRMTYFTDREEAENAVGPHGYYDNTDEGARYDYAEWYLPRHIKGTIQKPSTAASWHEDMEYAQGGPEDGWTNLATGLYDSEQEGLVRDTWYGGDSLSGLSSLWDTGLDMVWLDEHYQAEAEAHYVMTRTDVNEQTPYYVEVEGQYHGSGDQVFRIWYHYDTEYTPHDFAELTEYYEYYVTRDGVRVPIEMHHSETGKTMFTASLELNKIRFAVIGTQLELEELHTLLDHLNLSALTR